MSGIEKRSQIERLTIMNGMAAGLLEEVKHGTVEDEISVEELTGNLLSTINSIENLLLKRIEG